MERPWLAVSRGRVGNRPGRGTSPRIVPHDLWERIKPLLPKKERRFRDPGRLPVPDRQVLCGILYVLHTGIQWEHLPGELGFGSGMTCWRRLRDWNEAGAWQRLHEVLLAELNAAARLDWSRCVVDSSHVRALRGGLHRPLAGRPGPSRLQAPPDHRRARDTARGHPHRRQPQRRHAAHTPAGRHPARPRTGRPSTTQAGLAVRRPRLRPRHLPRPDPRSRHRPSHHPPQYTARHGARRLPVGGGAHLCPAARLPTAPCPLGTPCRHPRSFR